jgi:hypothetical protein
MSMAYDANGRALGTVKGGVAAGYGIRYGPDGRVQGLVPIHGTPGVNGATAVVADPSPYRESSPGAGDHQPMPKQPVTPTGPAAGVSAGAPYDPATQAALNRTSWEAGQTELDINREQTDYLDRAGLKIGPDGLPVLDTTNPRGRAFMIQRQWEAAKKGNAGRQLYAGAFQNKMRNDLEGESLAFGNLIGDGQKALAGFNAARERNVGSAGFGAAEIKAAFTGSQSGPPQPGNLGAPPAPLAPKPGPVAKAAKKLKSYVKDGWFYREDAGGSGEYHRIRKATG